MMIRGLVGPLSRRVICLFTGQRGLTSYLWINIIRISSLELKVWVVTFNSLIIFCLVCDISCAV